MAVVETVNKRTAYIALNNGTSASGAVQTVNVSLGQINKDAWDAQKAMNIAELLEPCMSKTLHAVMSTATSNLATQS